MSYPSPTVVSLTAVETRDAALVGSMALQQQYPTLDVEGVGWELVLWHLRAFTTRFVRATYHTARYTHQT